MHFVEHIEKTFVLQQMPFNVRLRSFVQRIPVLRRFSRNALSPLLSEKGAFEYRRGESSSRIEFKGRNLQFSALYDDCYRHGYELETAALVYLLCRGSSTFFDVGAN